MLVMGQSSYYYTTFSINNIYSLEKTKKSQEMMITNHRNNNRVSVICGACNWNPRMREDIRCDEMYLKK